MRNKTSQKKLQDARTESFSRNSFAVVLQTRSSREFFRFTEGRVEEYDATRLNGHEIKLTEEERAGLDEFDSRI